MPIPLKPKLNNPVTGIAGPSQLALIEHWAKEVPENGIVVEIGSFTGRSAWHWSKSVHHSVTVYCIDRWDPEFFKPAKPQNMFGNSTSIEDAICSFEVFKSNVKDCHNIVPIQAKSPEIPKEFEDKLVQVDLVYIDDSHVNPDFSNNFNYWLYRLKKGGVFCGDDFNKKDVSDYVTKFAVANRKQIYARSNYWRLYDLDEKIDLCD